ncbi:MAG: ATP-dependent DNA helicase RecG, partial [Gammaproteobacteria bacterium]
MSVPSSPQRPITTLRGVGPKVAERFARLRIHTVEDLLFHLPLRYEDRTRVVPIGSLARGGTGVIAGTIDLAQVRFGRRRSLVCVVSDGTGQAVLRFFHFNDNQRERLVQGARIRCFGDFRSGPNGLEIVHPEYRIVELAEPVEVEAHLTAVYPATEGLNQSAIRRYMDLALQLLERRETLHELLPSAVLEQLAYPSLEDALLFVHKPPPDTTTAALEAGELPAQRRLAFEELLAHHLSMRLVRRQIDDQRAPKLSGTGKLTSTLLSNLPFALTGAQRRATDEISEDLSHTRPMYRLLQGDVGSGKTIVAALCALKAIESGQQVVLMAPTELLAEQHLRNFSAWLEPLGVRLAWLSGKVAAGARRATVAALAAGEVDLAIGTHALFQDDVQFSNLALVLIDEQHRFGVGQRLALREKGVRDSVHPHQLIM